nr:MAG TPA: hypothetical protein [Caudoviricetes sp.]
MAKKSTKKVTNTFKNIHIFSLSCRYKIKKLSDANINILLIAQLSEWIVL